MQAWQFTGAGRPLTLGEVPEPVVGPGQVVVAVRAAGLCHSDVGALRSPDFVPFPMPVPVTMGHEIAGAVAAIGPDVEGWQIDDRVSVLLGQDAPVGFARDGGYQPRVLLGADDLVAIPDGVSFEEAAVATDAGVTAHLALVTTGALRAGHRVGIIGYGGLGQFGVQIAVALGAEVHVAEVKESVWPEALAAGAVSAVRDLGELSGIAFDVIVDFAGSGTTTAGAIQAVRPGGRVVQVGLGTQHATIDTWALVAKNVSLTGALGGSRDDLAGVLDLFATGRLHPVLERVSFADIPAALDRLAAHDVTGRLVAVYP